MESLEPAASTTPTKRWLQLIALTLLSMLSVSMALWAVWPSLTAVAYTADGSSTQLQKMPWVFHDAAYGARLQVTLPMHWNTPRVWRVVPDDELLRIMVNGNLVPLHDIPAGALTDWGKGFEFDFSPWLISGNNTLEFTLNNHGGDGGLTLHPQLGYRWILIWASFLPWLYTLSRAFRLCAHQVLPLCLALAVICSYWSVTPWMTRVHDAWGGDGHIDYVIRVAETLALPKPNESWEFFQPPLYYIGGAVIWRWAQWLRMPGPESLQAYSLALWMIFLAASAAALNIALRHRTSHVSLATLAVASWPGGIILSICINNDVGLYACAGLATWCMAQWWRRRQQRHLIAMSLFAGLSLLDKSNGVVLCAAVIYLLTLHTLRHQRWRQTKPWLSFGLALMVMMLGALPKLGRNLYYYWHGELPDWLIGNAVNGLGDWLRVSNKVANFIPLDIPTFLTVSWLSVVDDATGRGNFWNFLLRSSLSGEYNFGEHLQQFIAWGWGALLLILIIVVLSHGRALLDPRKFWRMAPWFVLGGIWLASLLAFRIESPYSCNNDFRYVAPLIVPFVIACTNAGRFARIALLGISLGSVVFFTTLQYG